MDVATNELVTWFFHLGCNNVENLVTFLYRCIALRHNFSAVKTGNELSFHKTFYRSFISSSNSFVVDQPNEFITTKCVFERHDYLCVAQFFQIVLTVFRPKFNLNLPKLLLFECSCI